MSTTAHTPGPWAVCETLCKGNRVLGVTVDDGKSGFPIAELSNTSGRDRADARLIAAAPDMLAALKNIGALLGENYRNSKKSSLHDDDLWAAFSHVIAAVAKAEGRS